MQPLKPIGLYKNEAVVQRMQAKHDLSRADAEILFEDTKKFLALSTMTNEEISPTGMIDKGWHEFLMFTSDYAEFCHEYLGKFVHHVPFGPGDSSGREQTMRGISLAGQRFGELSCNWSLGVSSAGDCSPDSNCESAPSDCALNISKQQFAWPVQRKTAA